MAKSLQKLLSLFLAGLMCFTLLPVSALAETMEDIPTEPNEEIIEEGIPAPEEEHVHEGKEDLHPEEVTEVPLEEAKEEPTEETPAEEPAEEPQDLFKEPAEEPTDEPAPAVEGENEEEEPAQFVTETFTFEDITFSEGELDNDELFRLYAEREFGTDFGEVNEEDENTASAPALFSSAIPSGGFPEGSLAREFYYSIVDLFKKIANGEETQAKLTFTRNLTLSQLGLSTKPNNYDTMNKAVDLLYFRRVINAVLLDCPYEAYWYDKTTGAALSVSGGWMGDEFQFTATLYFDVANAYKKAGSLRYNDKFDYEADIAKTGAISAAINNVNTIVSRHASKTDMEKLLAYKEEICTLTDYNYDAAKSLITIYGDPWQLIWVFDGDPTTKVVCEGYSKAFQYLSEKSAFTNPTIRVLLATGLMNKGAHMWNLVEKGNGRYLVDITNCDDGTLGYSDKLFMKVGEAVPENDPQNANRSYDLSKFVSGELIYEYDQKPDSSMKGVYGEGYPALKEDTTPQNFTVTFNASAENITTQTVQSGTKATEPTKPTGEEGYAFCGWYTVNEGFSESSKWDFDTPITGNIELWARWELKPISISISSTNHKISYYVGGELDTSNLTILVTNTDNTQETVAVTEDMVTGFDNAIPTDNQTLTITYRDVTTTFEIEILENTPITSLSLTSNAPKVGQQNEIPDVLVASIMPEGNNAIISEKFWAGMAGFPATEVYKKDFTYLLALRIEPIEGFVFAEDAVITLNGEALDSLEDELRLDDKELFILKETYATPDGKAVTGISINSTNHKIDYKVRDYPDYTGLTIAVSKSDGTFEIVNVTPDMVTGFDSSHANNELPLTISYLGKTATYNIRVDNYFYNIVLDSGAGTGTSIAIPQTGDFTLPDCPDTFTPPEAQRSQEFKYWAKTYPGGERYDVGDVYIPTADGGNLIFVAVWGNVCNTHKKGSAQTYPAHDATETTPGNSKFTYYQCTVCGDWVDKNNNNISKDDMLLKYRTYMKLNSVVIMNGEEEAKSEFFVKRSDGSTSLTAVVGPATGEGVIPNPVKWSTSSSSIATVDNGTITFKKTGTVTITATATNNSKAKDTVKLNIVVPASSVSFTTETDALASGKKFTFKATGDSGATNKGVNWSLVCPEEFLNFVTLSSTGELKVSSELMTKTEVTVKATAKDGFGAYAQKTVQVAPITSKVVIKDGETEVMGKTLTVNLTNIEDISTPIKDFYTYTTPFDASDAVTWSSSDKSVIVDAEGKVTLKSLPTKAKTVTLTATAADGSKVKATVKLYLSYLVDEVNISGSNVLATTKSIKLSASAITNKFDAKGKAIAPTNSGLTWESSDPAVATVSKGTVKGITPGVVTITASASDGSGKTASLNVQVFPAVTSVAIDKITGVEGVTEQKDKKGNTTGYALKMPTVTELTLTATADPSDAAQTVSWKSSSTKVATIDPNTGLVTLKAPGTTTITATAMDGTSKKTTTKLTVIQLMETIDINAPSTVLASGNSMTFKPVIGPGSTSDKKVSYELVGGTVDSKGNSTLAGVASLSSSGKLTADKNLTANQDVKVVVTAKDGSGTTDSCTVGLWPITNKVSIKAPEETEGFSYIRNAKTGAITGYQLDATKKSTLDLDTVLYDKKDDNNCAQVVTWKSSSTKIADISAEGIVTAKTKGTVTFTATAADGSGKKDTLKLTIVKTVESVTLEDAKVAVGKNITLKPTINPSDANNTKVSWSMTNPNSLLYTLTVSSSTTLKNTSGKTVATLSSSGKVSTTSITPAGLELTITATAQGAAPGETVADTCTVTVVPLASSVKITDAPNSLAVGKTADLGAVVYPNTSSPAASQNVTWKSSSTRIATVDANGIVTAKKKGSVTITATAADGSGKNATVNIMVTV